MNITKKMHLERVARIENQLKQNKLIVKKRNQLISSMLEKFTDPLWVGNIIALLYDFAEREFAGRKWGREKPTLEEYLIMLHLRHSLSFTYMEVIEAIEKLPPSFREGVDISRQYAICKLRTFKRMGFTRSFEYERNHVWTPKAKVFMIEIMEKFRRTLLKQMVQPSTFSKKRRRGII